MLTAPPNTLTSLYEGQERLNKGGEKRDERGRSKKPDTTDYGRPPRTSLRKPRDDPPATESSKSKKKIDRDDELKADGSRRPRRESPKSESESDGTKDVPSKCKREPERVAFLEEQTKSETDEKEGSVKSESKSESGEREEEEEADCSGESEATNDWRFEKKEDNPDRWRSRPSSTMESLFGEGSESRSNGEEKEEEMTDDQGGTAVSLVPGPAVQLRRRAVGMTRRWSESNWPLSFDDVIETPGDLGKDIENFREEVLTARRSSAEVEEGIRLMEENPNMIPFEDSNDENLATAMRAHVLMNHLKNFPTEDPKDPADVDNVRRYGRPLTKKQTRRSERRFEILPVKMQINQEDNRSKFRRGQFEGYEVFIGEFSYLCRKTVWRKAKNNTHIIEQFIDNPHEGGDKSTVMIREATEPQEETPRNRVKLRFGARGNKQISEIAKKAAKLKIDLESRRRKISDEIFEMYLSGRREEESTSEEREPSPKREEEGHGARSGKRRRNNDWPWRNEDQQLKPGNDDRSPDKKD